MAKKINKSAKDGKIVSDEFAEQNPDTTFATEVVAPKKAAKSKADDIPEIEIMGGTYKLSDLMVQLGFPGFSQDAARLFEKGIVSVDGETVTADAEYEIGNIVIEKGEQQFRVIGLVLTAPK
jgi:hypothetical protein